MLSEKLISLRRKSGLSQQELADRISVTRQTISNWECGQGAPALDKAAELASIYHVSLDDLVGDNVGIIVRSKKNPNRLLKSLEGRRVKISCKDKEIAMEVGFDWGYSGIVKVLEVTDDWLRIEYTRTKENSLTKKETVVKLMEIGTLNGFELVEDAE
ncbi:MAG: helix-turn-helix transcriptional regulator [Bacteroidales bacterium]|nr:helix-turn-helix transcriptional regulator [Bacteroidales bacterium]